MRDLLSLLALGPISLISALDIGRSSNTPIKFGIVTIEGPNCTSMISNTTFYNGDPRNATNPKVVAIVRFAAMTATAFPKAKNDTSHTDCTISVNFTFPKGYQMSEAAVVADGTVLWESGMVRDTRMDVWFPTRPNFVASNQTHTLSSDMKARILGNSFGTWTNVGGQFWDALAGKSQIKARIRQELSISSNMDSGKGGKSTIDTLFVMLDAGTFDNPNEW